ncbi:MAG: hypothetical protein ACRCYV_01985 [Aeromonas sp.]
MRIGGSLEKSLSAGYRLNVKGILTEGWGITRQQGFGLLLAIIAVTCLWFLLSNQLLVPLLSQNPTEESHLTLLLSLLITVIMAPMTSALDMLGMQQAVGARARAAQVFDYFRYFVRLALLSVLSSLCTSAFGPLFELLGLPVMLSLIPSALFGMGLLLAVPLTLERGLTPLSAIIVSFKVVLHGLPSILLFHTVMLVLLFIALLPMGLGLIWVAPLYFNCKGIIYRDLCGIAVEVREVPKAPDEFHA